MNTVRAFYLLLPMHTPIIVTGSLAYDRIMDFSGLFVDQIVPENIHKLSVSFNIESLDEKHGGTAGNIAYNLSLFGLAPKIVASAGNDFESYKQSLADRGVDVSGIEIQPTVKTAVAHIMSDQENNQITSFYMGAMGTPTTIDLSTIAPETIITLSPGNKDDMLRYKKEALATGARDIVDPGQTLNWLSGDEIKSLLTDCFICIVNDYEYSLIKQKTGLDDVAIEALCRTLIITQGASGSTVITGGTRTLIPAAVVKAVVDATGAGDAYRAGLIFGLVNGLIIEDAARIGSVAGAYAVEAVGTQTYEWAARDFATRFTSAFSQAFPVDGFVN